MCSLISAVGIFCLGAGVSIVHGIHAILDPAISTEAGWGLAVLLLSTVVEGYTLLVAIRAVHAGAAAAGMRFLDFVRSGRDPVSVAIMAEDGAAVAGVIVAAVCTQLVSVTGQAVRRRCELHALAPPTATCRCCWAFACLWQRPSGRGALGQRVSLTRRAVEAASMLLWVQIWDGIGGILVGCLLAGVAVYLIQRNRSFLIGRSMMDQDFQKIIRHLKRDPVIKNIYEAKSEEIGEGIYRSAIA
jgi:solute carrier family 30 (zinc transporter), member 9